MGDFELLQYERRSGREKKESARIKEAKDEDWTGKVIRFERGPLERRNKSRPSSPGGTPPDAQLLSLQIPLDSSHTMLRSYPMAVPLRPSSVPNDFEAFVPLSPRSKGETRRITPRKQDVETSYNASPRGKRSVTYLPNVTPIDQPMDVTPIILDETSALSAKAKVIELVPEAAKAVYEDHIAEANAQWLGLSTPWPPAYCANLPALTAEGRSFYPSVTLNGVEYQLFDNVIVRPALGGMLNGVARIVALFEESPSGRKYFFVEWFFRKPDVHTHLLLMRDVEELLRNPLPTEDDPLGEKRAVRRGRPPKKRRGNIEESLQWLDYSLDHEIWNSPRPYYSAIPISAVSAPCLIEHVPHHIVAQPLPADRSPDGPQRFMYRKSYDPRTCYMPCSKPRNTLLSPGSLVPTATTQSIGDSLLSHSGAATFYMGSQSTQAAHTSTNAATTPLASKAVKLALRSESFSSLPTTTWDYEVDTLSPRSKVQKTSEVDHAAVHRHSNFNISQSLDNSAYGAAHGHAQHLSNQGVGHQFGGHQAAQQNGHASRVQPPNLNFSRLNGFESMDVSTSHHSHSMSSPTPQAHQTQHHQGMTHFGFQASPGLPSPRPLQQSTGPTFRLPNATTANANTTWNNGMAAVQEYHAASAVTNPAAVAVSHPMSPEVEVVTLRARMEQMTEDFYSMQQSMTEMRETVLHLQMQQQHYFAPPLPRQSVNNDMDHSIPAGFSAASYHMSTNSAASFAAGNSASAHQSASAHVNFVPNRPSTMMSASVAGAAHNLARNTSFGTSLKMMSPAATANFSALEQQDIIVAPNDLKEDVYDSQLDDFSVSSDPTRIEDDSSPFSQFQHHHMVLSERSMHPLLHFSHSFSSNGDLISSAPQAGVDMGIEHFFMPEHVTAQ